MNDPISEEQYQRLCAYAFDEQSAQERQAFEAELAANPALQAELDQLQASADLVREFAPDAPAELSAASRGALTSAAQSGGGAPQPVQAKPSKPTPWFLHPALQVAAAASLAVVGFRALEGVVGPNARHSNSELGYRESGDMVARSNSVPFTADPKVSESMRELLEGAGYTDSLGYVESEEAEGFLSALGYTGRDSEQRSGNILWKTGGGGKAGASFDPSALTVAATPSIKPGQASEGNVGSVPTSGAIAPSETAAGSGDWFLGSGNTSTSASPATIGLGGGAGGGGRTSPNSGSPAPGSPASGGPGLGQAESGGAWGMTPNAGGRFRGAGDVVPPGGGIKKVEAATAARSFLAEPLVLERAREQADELGLLFALDAETIDGYYEDVFAAAVRDVARDAVDGEQDAAPSGSYRESIPAEDPALEELVESLTEDEKVAVLLEVQKAIAADQAEAQRLEEERIEQLYQGLIQRTQRHPDEKPSMMYFRFWGDNGFEFPVQDALSTFAADVDTASYTLARKYIQDGYLPERAQIRTEEFVNYFTPDVPAPTEGSTFNVTHELAPSPFGPQGADHDAAQAGPSTAVADLSQERWTLRVGVRGKEIPKAERDPLALTFVIDVSGSMEQEGRLELVKHSLRLLMNELYPSDQIAIITFSNEAKRVLTMQPVSNRAAIEQALFDMRPDGGTNAEAGLLKGYEEAVLGFTEGAVNRVVFLSDGVGNIGETNEQQLLDEVKRARDKGIYLNTVGVGMGNHNDRFLEQLANGGDGLCNYVDGPAEAERALVTNFTSAMQPIARDVKLQVEFDPSQVIAYRLLGYENRAIADADFRNDKVDAGELGSGHQVVALYELVLGDVDTSGERPLVTTRVRHKVPHGEREEGAEDKATEAAFTGSWSHATGTFDGASIGFQKSALAAQFAEMLRRSTHAKDDSLSLLRLKLEELDRRTEDAELTELAALVRLAQPQLEAALSAPIPPAQQAFDELAQFEWRCGFSTYLERDLEDDVITSRREELRQNLREALR